MTKNKILKFLIALNITTYGMLFFLIFIEQGPVTGCSMMPTLPCDHYGFGLRTQSLNIGDIATYKKTVENKTEYVLHRAIAYDEDNDCFIFRGDANIYNDSECVPRSDVYSKFLFMIPNLT